MTKQELLVKLNERKELAEGQRDFSDDYQLSTSGFGEVVGVECAIELVRQLDEPPSEQTEPCEVCNPQDDIFTVAINYEFWSICDGDNEAISNSDGWRPAIYCPNCGRKLED
jgi:hypothetical protein